MGRWSGVSNGAPGVSALQRQNRTLSPYDLEAMRSNSHLRAASTPRALGVALRQALHLRESFQLRLGRAERQPGLAGIIKNVRERGRGDQADPGAERGQQQDVRAGDP